MAMIVLNLFSENPRQKYENELQSQVAHHNFLALVQT